MHEREAKILDCLPAIYEAAMGPQHWSTALDAVAELAQAKGAMLYRMGPNESLYSTQYSNSIYSNKTEAIAEYIRKFGHYDREGLSAVQTSPAFQPVHDTDIWPNLALLEEREDIRFIKEFMGLFRRVAFNLSGASYLNAGLVFQYDESFRHAPLDGISFGRDLGPHVAKALQICRFFDPLRQRYQAILSVLDRMHVGLGVATPTGEIVLMNEMARQTTEEGKGLRFNRWGRLEASDPQTSSAINAAIASTSQTAAGTNKTPGQEIVAHGDYDTSLLVIVSPLRDADSEIEQGFSGALITMVDPGAETRIPIDVVKGFFMLTDAEAEVAQLLLRGIDVYQIAEVRSVSQQTIQSQIKSLYSKASVNSRHAFMWKAMQLLPPVN